MKDKIIEFLANAGGQASVLAIARQVLRLSHASAPMAECVLASLLQNDPRFATDGLGNWHLLPAPSTGVAAEAVKIFLVETPMRTPEILQARRLVLGWTVFDETAETPVEIAEILFSPLSSHADENYRQLSRNEFVARYTAPFADGILLSWQPHAVTKALHKIFATTERAWFPPTIVSLATLARNLLNLNRRPELPALYRQLCGTELWRDSPAETLKAQIEILRILLVKCRERGLKNWRQIATFARRPRRADFTRYKFDEKYIDNLPERPGVYLMRNAAQRVLYVGKAANLRARVRSYFQAPEAEDRKLQQLRSQMFVLDYKIVAGELEALLLEHRLIRRLQPEINRQKKIVPPAFPQRARLPCIFLVPVHPDSATSTKGRVIVYFLSSHSLQRLSVQIGRKPGKRLSRALAKFYEEAAAGVPQELVSRERERLEIAGRWLQQHAAKINILDPAAGAGLGELEERLHALLRSPEILTEKFH